MIDSEGTNQVKLINEDFKAFAPIISPDGEKIIFSSNKSGRYEVYIINTDGINCRKLTNIPPVDKHPVSYFPDGKRIIFFAGELQIPTPKEYYKEYKDFDIYSIGTNGEGIKKLTHILSLFWDLSLSPDGKNIVFSEFCNDNYEIFIMDKDGNNKKKLTNNSVRDCASTWSPDGKKIAYVSDGMLYLMNPDGKNQVKLIDKTQCYVSYGVWSPDGKKIAFVAEGDIYTIDIDGKNLKNLTNTPDWDESCPSWRPIAKD